MSGQHGKGAVGAVRLAILACWILLILAGLSWLLGMKGAAAGLVLVVPCILWGVGRMMR